MFPLYPVPFTKIGEFNLVLSNNGKMYLSFIVILRVSKGFILKRSFWLLTMIVSEEKMVIFVNSSAIRTLTIGTPESSVL